MINTNLDLLGCDFSRSSISWRSCTKNITTRYVVSRIHFLPRVTVDEKCEDESTRH